MGRAANVRYARVALLALDSDRYPAIGESHGISVLAGCIQTHLRDQLNALVVIDLVAQSHVDSSYLCEEIRSFQPNIIGISVSYGTLSRLRTLYSKIRGCVTQGPPLILFGGAIATYLPEQLLQIDPTAIVVMGEGEDATVAVIRRWLGGLSFEGIPNICYLQHSRIQAHPRSIVDLSVTPPPYRDHVGPLAARGAQIFVESSRACSWAACTFCLRGLTDVLGKSSEYRRFPIGRLMTDIKRLRSLAVPAVTFADEDFLGGPLDDIENFVANLKSAFLGSNLFIPFDISATVQSLSPRSRLPQEQAQERARIRNILMILKQLGLAKIFLGVESGNPSQLKRYAKGHTPADCARAVSLVRSLNIDFEIGWIMFDPLCTTSEIKQNIIFLKDNDLVHRVSAIGSELRLQIGTRYLEMLKRVEVQRGYQICGSTLDADTLSYAYSYTDACVRDVVRRASEWNAYMRPLHYTLKNLARYGTGGMLGTQAANEAKRLLGIFRAAYADRLCEAVTAIECVGSVPKAIDTRFKADVKELAHGIINLLGGLSHDARNSRVIEDLLCAAAEHMN